jgi:hypothetical protein
MSVKNCCSAVLRLEKKIIKFWKNLEELVELKQARPAYKAALTLKIPCCFFSRGKASHTSGRAISVLLQRSPNDDSSIEAVVHPRVISWLGLPPENTSY